MGYYERQDYRILVIDDKEVNHQSARETLKGHRLTHVSSYDEAVKQLKPAINLESLWKASELLGSPTGDLRSTSWLKYFRANESLVDAFTERFNFDVVLIDMMMPMSRYSLRPGIYEEGVEVPYGPILALMAANRGAKYVLMVTNTDHHDRPISAALDHIKKDTIIINGARVLLTHDDNHVHQLAAGNGTGKDWGAILKELVDGTVGYP